jgi:hypothetical protein
MLVTQPHMCNLIFEGGVNARQHVTKTTSRMDNQAGAVNLEQG